MICSLGSHAGDYASRYLTSCVVINGYRGPVRASRLVGLLGLLQARGRMTTRQLSSELEVSQRTILRDIEELSTAGIPVYAVRGRHGGFQLVDGFISDLPAAGYLATRPAADRGLLRARVRLSPRGRRLAALLGRPAGVRVRRNAPPAAGREDWVEAWVRADSAAAALVELLALGAEVEVLHPRELRAQLGQTARLIAELHSGDSTSGGPG
jgi:predicted DNA-binding transcriptional regulator YafY